VSEQGFGDVIQFLRFVPKLPRERIVFLVPREMRRLIEFNFAAPNISFYNFGSPTVPSADYWQPICSLGSLYLRNDLDPAAYLRAPEGPRIERPTGSRLAIGVCWAGSSRHLADAARSSTAEAFVGALALPGVELYSFQTGAKNIDPALLGDMGIMQDLSPGIHDFADSASLLIQMDAIVTVDTALAHLSGALGVPTHVLIPYAAVDWRWGHDRKDSPWYRSMTLHRQAKGETWSQVLQRVAALLTGR